MNDNLRTEFQISHKCLTYAYVRIYNMSGDTMGNDKNALACGHSLYDSIDFDFYKALFDPVRSDILVYLVSHGKKSIKEISEKFFRRIVR